MQSDIHQLVKRFERQEGRRPRILVAEMGADGDGRGQTVAAAAFADLGFDVDVGPSKQTPANMARQAVENDVHVVSLSSLGDGPLTLLSGLREELAALGREDILTVVGGVDPVADRAALIEAGTVALFGSQTEIGETAIQLLRELADRLGLELDDAGSSTEA